MYHLDGQVSVKETNENEKKTNKQKEYCNLCGSTRLRWNTQCVHNTYI